MNRREFLTLSALTMAELSLIGKNLPVDKKKLSTPYSILILGDTHFDTAPASVYHSLYTEANSELNKVQRAEFARNGEMWQERCPNLIRRASRLVEPGTSMVFQMGDLVQGDCGDPKVHRQMLSDALDTLKGQLGNLPLITVVGNHDIRGTGADQAYKEYMPPRMSQELGHFVEDTTFWFHIGEDAFLFIDFNHPNEKLIHRMLKDSEGAWHTFVISHGPIFPCDGESCRWFLFGGKDEQSTASRRLLRTMLARRNAIVLCGHTHCTEFHDWYSPEGRITQMTFNSVWAKPEQSSYVITEDNPQNYGQKALEASSASPDTKALFEEYIPGLKKYSLSNAAGSYKLVVEKKRVKVDFYAGASEQLTKSFRLR